jgi:hypothetical protein
MGMGVFGWGGNASDDDEDEEGQEQGGGSFSWTGKGGSSYNLSFGNVTGSRFTIGDLGDDDDD